jgi:CheY-like chemotaxis protein
MDRAALTQIVSLLLDGAQRAVGETGFVHLLVTANASGKFAVRVSDSRHSCSFDLVTFTASSHAHDASLPDDMKTLKNLVASNNGKIFARTLENFGTTILVEFDVGVLITTPFKPMSLLPTIPDEAVFVPSDVVLLLDDNKDILNFLKKWIESIGLKALTFEKSFDAISHVERHRPDLKAFVIDVSLPAVDGIDTAKIFTQHAKYRRLPFLFSTGYSMERVASRLTHFERASVLQKPISREEFIEHFNTFVNATSN